MTVDETYDLVIIGAGEAGQATAHLARKLGGRVAIVNTRNPIELAARASKCTQVDRPSPDTEEVKPQTRP